MAKLKAVATGGNGRLNRGAGQRRIYGVLGLHLDFSLGRQWDRLNTLMEMIYHSVDHL